MSEPYEVRIPLSRLEWEVLERVRLRSAPRVLFYQWARVTLLVHAARVLDGIEVPLPLTIEDGSGKRTKRAKVSPAPKQEPGDG